MNGKDFDSAVSGAGSLLNDLEPFLKRAEKWNQGQRLAGAIVSLAVVVLLLSGALPAPVLTAFVFAIFAISLLTIKRRVLEAEVFAVKDKAGKYRAALTSDKKNIALHFWGEKGDVLLSLGLTDKEEPYLTLFDPNLRPRALLGIPTGSSGPTLQLRGGDGKVYLHGEVSNDNKSDLWLGSLTGAHLLVSADDAMQSITILDGQNKSRASLHVSEKNAVVRLSSKSEPEASAEMGVYETTPSLVQFGESGKRLVILGANKGGSGKLDLFDNNGELAQRIP